MNIYQICVVICTIHNNFSSPNIVRRLLGWHTAYSEYFKIFHLTVCLVDLLFFIKMKIKIFLLDTKQIVLNEVNLNLKNPRNINTLDRKYSVLSDIWMVILIIDLFSICLYYQFAHSTSTQYHILGSLNDRNYCLSRRGIWMFWLWLCYKLESPK